jgi:hypothetical protein
LSFLAVYCKVKKRHVKRSLLSGWLFRCASFEIHSAMSGTWEHVTHTDKKGSMGAFASHDSVERTVSGIIAYEQPDMPDYEFTQSFLIEGRCTLPQSGFDIRGVLSYRISKQNR